MSFFRPWMAPAVIGPVALGEWLNYILSHESLPLISAIFCTACFFWCLFLWMTWPE